MYKYAVVIGRFEPYHLGHQKMLEKAFKLGERVVVVLGSARSARTPKNPWTAHEREEMILSALTDELKERIHITQVRDHFYNDGLWIAEVQNAVNAITDHSNDVCLVGHRKDSSSYYLSLFPQWKFEEHVAVNMMNATDIRKSFFDKDDDWAALVPSSIKEYLTNFQSLPIYGELKAEYDFINAYKEMWSHSPYPPTFVTVDAVVIKSGHVLVVKRRSAPGKGLWAIPGGFLNQNETLISGVIRELKEETGILVPPKELKSSIKDYQVFDHPDRSQRGRTITHAYLLDLGDGALPKVKGNDDAEKAIWLPYADVFANEDRFFEDHAAIISDFVWRK